MKVEDLIGFLQRMPKDARVFVFGENDDELYEPTPQLTSAWAQKTRVWASPHWSGSTEKIEAVLL